MKEMLNLVQFSSKILPFLENTEVFESFEGNGKFLETVMRCNYTEPTGLKILLSFGHLKRIQFKTSFMKQLISDEKGSFLKC